jgi:hypothetical protein
MLRVKLFRAAGSGVFIVAAALVEMSILQPGAARAADWYTGATAAKPNDDWIVAVDASATAAPDGSYFTGVSATVAAGGTLRTSGMRVRVEGLAGTYLFDSGAPGAQTRGDQVDAAILGGYEWVTAWSSMAAYGGLAVRDSRFSNPDPGHPDGAAFGAKGVLQYYATPSDRTMFSAYASYSSIYDAYYTRLKWGVTAVGPVYIGPEVAALGDDFYRQWRIGVHLTGLRLGAVQLGISGGYARNQNNQGGGYGSLDARVLY